MAALAEEWCKRQLERSPRWGVNKWRRLAAIHGAEYVADAHDTASDSGRDAA
ncbi:hypothetical protein [Microbispora rosea]|uniref:hypothetical protein n=1 Tax=Microbispora rosea TaxID=58117 RepID=UPI003410A3B1